MRKRVVAVNHLPEILSAKQGRLFLREVKSWMSVDRPRMVLDCSHVQQLNGSLIYLLVRCLEEAMKRNGDLKLAALPPGAEAIMEHTGADRLFDIYDTTAEAVNSFHQFPVGVISRTPVRTHREPENVA